ncbi:UvrD/REP helicase [Alicyclobacillus hesperidum URH17-3-68]|nr:UvrD/REP helicase [Alicyclobacillus hesperidum URH17-3-68]
MVGKYPFLFLDEFQDTNTIQVEIVKWFANAGSIVGVIGDPAQSIYSFQGASREAFVNFTLPNQSTYVIENNRRSGTRIVELLNFLRDADDVTQSTIRHNSVHEVYFLEEDGNPTQIVQCFHELRRHLGMDSDYCILARKNETVKLLRNSNSVDVWRVFEEADSSEREPFIRGILTGYKLAMDNRQELAIKEIVRALRSNRDRMLRNPFKENQLISSLIKRSLAVDLLEYMVGELNNLEDIVFTDFYESLRQFFEVRNYGLKKITSGKIKQFSDETTLTVLLDNLTLPEEKSSNVRTIHKAKGAEFQSVLLYLTDLDDVKKLVKPDIDSKNDDTRLLYVALSRAKDLLCIACPPLDTQLRNKLRSMNLIQYTTDKAPVGTA